MKSKPFYTNLSEQNEVYPLSDVLQSFRQTNNGWLLRARTEIKQLLVYSDSPHKNEVKRSQDRAILFLGELDNYLEKHYGKR